MVELIALEIMSRYLRMLNKEFFWLHGRYTVGKNRGTWDRFQHFGKIQSLGL